MNQLNDLVDTFVIADHIIIEYDSFPYEKTKANPKRPGPVNVQNCFRRLVTISPGLNLTERQNRTTTT